MQILRRYGLWAAVFIILGLNTYAITIEHDLIVQLKEDIRLVQTVVTARGELQDAQLETERLLDQETTLLIKQWREAQR